MSRLFLPRVRVTGLACRRLCSASSSSRITSPRFRSNALTVIQRHYTVARMSAANIRFNTCRSPMASAMTLNQHTWDMTARGGGAVALTRRDRSG